MSPVLVPQSTLDRFKKVSAATVWTAVRRFGSPRCTMEGLLPMTPGRRMAARARTLRTLPPRPDLQGEMPRGENSTVGQAIALCGPGDALVVDGMKQPASAPLGDVLLLQLKMQKADALVLDCGIRDLDIVRTYGFAVFALARTPNASENVMAYQFNVDIQCAGVLVRPGDVLVGDDDGVVVVPSHQAEEIIAWVEEHEEAEEYAKEKIVAENVRPGKYYPPSEEFIREMHRAKGRL
ncbi:MAG: hypothetical protein HY680_04825 [Chloroflexi bacterium]|nr:hypothetical protein [Chloroflexota bacterium]